MKQLFWKSLTWITFSLMSIQCSDNTQNEYPMVGNNGVENDELSKNLDEWAASVRGRPGVIGEFDATAYPPNSNLNDLWNAIGLVRFSPENGAPHIYSNGTLIQSTSVEGWYILTAKHLFYNEVTGKILPGRGVIGFDTGVKSFGEIDLSSLPENFLNNYTESDLVILPITQVDIAPVSIAKSTGSLLGTNPRIHSTSIIANEGVVFKFSQSLFENHQKFRGKTRSQYLNSDIDAIPGMSGSPITETQSDGTAIVVGIIIKGSQVENCEVYSEFYCRNTIELVK